VHDKTADGHGGIAGHAGLFGDAAGVARLGSQFLPGSRLFELDELALFVTSRTPGGAQERSVGFRIGDAAAGDALSPRAFGHTGFTGASLFIDPQTAALFVLLTNRVHPVVPDTDMQALRRDFHRLAIALLAPESEPPALE
jgi:CubicO group peptidase (beta-lactamase class C family)